VFFIFNKQMLTLQISHEAAIALVTLLHTVDFSDAASSCSDFTADDLKRDCKEIVVALSDALRA